VIHHLGLGGYGIWSIIIVTAAYMRFGSAGIKSAFQKYVAEATGNGDFQTANKLVSTGSFTMLALSLTTLIPVALLSHKIARASGVPPEFLSAAAASIAVLACIYAVSNFGAAFEAIVMGGHRIDLTRKYSTILTVCEAVVIVVMLHFGYGLLAMTLVMGISELIYIFCCYRASLSVVPEMQIRMAHFTKSAFPELVRFAGSYQLINVLELMYGAILPVALLKCFGAEAAGVFAVASRVVTSGLIAQDALVLPILSGGTMVFASGSIEQTKLFLAKSFKVTLAAALLPLAFVAAFGTSLVFAWTGQVDPRFRAAIWLTALAALLKAISLLQLVLYRASGRALLDNIRQVLRILGNSGGGILWPKPWLQWSSGRNGWRRADRSSLYVLCHGSDVSRLQRKDIYCGCRANFIGRGADCRGRSPCRNGPNPVEYGRTADGNDEARRNRTWMPGRCLAGVGHHSIGFHCGETHHTRDGLATPNCDGRRRLSG
jgi:O-antigen/teichoic acid export membrane protein